MEAGTRQKPQQRGSREYGEGRCYDAGRMASRRLPASVVASLRKSLVVGVRAGDSHRFIGVWVVVVGDRVFVRSYTLKRGGWYWTFREDPTGAIQAGSRVVRIRAIPIRAERVLNAVDEAYAEKYHRPGSRKYVRGFRRPSRRAATIEFVPARSRRG